MLEQRLGGFHRKADEAGPNVRLFDIMRHQIKVI